MRHLITLLITILIFGCQNESKKKITQIEDTIFQPENALSPLFDSIRIPNQKYIINSHKDTLLICQKGTKIFINESTFLDEFNNYPDTIELEIVEVKTISDIIRTNLQTVSNDNILQTGGMLFIDAKSNGKPLKLNGNSSIFIESSSKRLDTRMQLYNGEFKENGQINWINERNLEKSLIAVPLDLLDYNLGSWECRYSEKQIQKLKNPNHENTYIATREFEIRMFTFSTSTCDWTKGLADRIIEIYVDNIGNDLFFPDSLVADYIIGTHGDNIDTTKQFDFNTDGWYSYMYKSAIDFSKQKLTRPYNFEEHGITDSTTTKELISQGYSKSEAQKIIAQYGIQKQTIGELKNNRNAQRLAKYAFEVNKLGWINIDALLDNESMKESDFTVLVNSSDSLKNISLSLVLPDYNVSIFPIQQDSIMFSFTKKMNGYRKLPVDRQAIIVGFSYKDGVAYYGKKEVKIPDQGVIKLDLERKTVDEIKIDVEKLIE